MYVCLRRVENTHSVCVCVSVWPWPKHITRPIVVDVVIFLAREGGGCSAVTAGGDGAYARAHVLMLGCQCVGVCACLHVWAFVLLHIQRHTHIHMCEHDAECILGLVVCECVLMGLICVMSLFGLHQTRFS